MKSKYEIIIYWSAEDQSYIAEVPELSGCMADGKTYQEALSNVEVIIQEWIETAKELKRPIPQPKGKLMYA
ncbi:type II toxin-antitoxin system HicB family antitoxin [Candidatus Kuenenia sp.]|uniref:type II toxin-antitoxin system HicB family antitoxin n=1 Tax=Candidatus Kuenenia sp. TaxID=2499824 RepID=UPI00321FF218